PQWTTEFRCGARHRLTWLSLSTQGGGEPWPCRARRDALGLDESADVGRLTLASATVAAAAEDGIELRIGNVVIEDGVIVDLGDVPTAGRTIDCAGKLVLPGLVNAHAHTTEVLFRGLGAD